MISKDERPVAPDHSPTKRATKLPVNLPVKLPIKQLLLVLGMVATVYAAALLIWGNSPTDSLARLWSLTGLQAAALCLLNYLLRGMRWRLWMAHYGRHFGWLEGLRLYLAGYAFTPTPGNVGEAVRGLMLTRNPLSARHSLAIFGAERLADLLCLLLFCLPVVGWLLGHEEVQKTVLEALQAPPRLLVILVVALVVGLTALVVLFLQYRALWRQRLSWLKQAWHCLAVRPLSWFVLTMTAWAAQGLAVWLICKDAGVDVPMLTAMAFYAVAMVAGALSALPAGLGGTEAVLTGLLVMESATPAAALTITVLTRLLTLWLAVGIGVMALLYSAAIRKDISFR